MSTTWGRSFSEQLIAPLKGKPPFTFPVGFSPIEFGPAGTGISPNERGSL